jgi:endonuclease-8
VPEGDTIFRTARTLDRALAGRGLVRLDASPVAAGAAPARSGAGPARAGPDPGTPVSGVEARGKHLLVHFGDGRALHTHLGMTGTWHLYRRRERWRKPARAARAVVEVDGGWVAVCFSAPVVELLPPGGLTRHPVLSGLGPDLCREGVDLGEALARLDRLARLSPSTEIGVALLDQRVASGVGNVYKSEACFACGVDPFAAVAALDGATRRRLLATASEQLRANLDGAGRRRTTATGLAVYGRAGRPCPRCATPIRRRLQGEHARPTFWCARCQPRP